MALAAAAGAARADDLTGFYVGGAFGKAWLDASDGLISGFGSDKHASQFIVGWLGMPRRYHDYYFAPEFQPYMLMSSIGSTVLALGLILPAFYLSYSLFKGPRASANPWGAHGLEWEVPSPPPSHNFHEIPIVTDEVYDFDPVSEYEQEMAEREILKKKSALPGVGS